MTLWKLTQSPLPGSDESDIQVIACYREQPAFSETSVAGRQMTIDTTQCFGDDSSSLWPGDEFIEQLLQADYDYLVMGAGPPVRDGSNGYDISQRAGLPPIHDSPISPPLHERGPSYPGGEYSGIIVTNNYCATNSHIQGISIRVSNKCGERTSPTLETVWFVAGLTSKSGKCPHLLF